MNRIGNNVLVFVLVLGFGVSLVPCVHAQPAANKRPNAPATFANTVWRVRTSPDVAPGQLYVFLSEGTLVIASPNSKPAFGSWTYQKGVLTMTEEGRRYKVDIVKLTPSEFRIRIYNPGKPTEMTLVPARATVSLSTKHEQIA